MVDGDDDEQPADTAAPPAGDELGIAYLHGPTLIGRGGFAHVYAATDTRFDRRVAVKVFDHLPTDVDRALFESECRTMGRLSGLPHVVTVHDIDYTADGRPCIVMALVSGGSLGDRLRRDGLIPWRRAVAWLVTVLRTLADAHDQGILHRDLKPENILVDGDRPYLTDFGLASIRGSAAAGRELDPAEAEVIASPLHAAPETFSGASRDERSDLYSAASTLYTLIAGHAPFQRHPDLSPAAIVERLRTQSPAPLPAGLAPSDLNALILRALAKDPAERPASARELADALQAVLDTHPAPARPVSGAAGATTSGPTPSTPSVPSATRAALTLPTITPQPPPAATAAPAAGPAPAAGSGVGPKAPAPSPWAATGGSTSTPASGGPSSGAGTSGTGTSGTGSSGTGSSGAGTSGTGTSGTGRTGRREIVGAILIACALITAVGLVALASADDSDPGRPALTGPFITRPRVTTTAPVSIPAALTGPTVPRSSLAAVPPLLDAETQWAAERAAVVAEIAANGWGWDQAAGTVTGPGGLLVDLTRCPAEWDPYQGVTADELRLGQIFPADETTGTTATSATTAADRPSDTTSRAEGFRLYLQYVNAHGGLGDSSGTARSLVVGLALDHPAFPPEERTVPGAFALQTLSSAGVDELADDQNTACVPDPFVPANGPGWNDPGQRPWLWADRLTSSAEGRLLGEIVGRSFPDRDTITVAALVSTDDVGRAAEQALRRYVAQAPQQIQLVVTQVDLPASSVANRMFDLALNEPDALLVLTGDPQTCATAVAATFDLDLPATTTVVASSSSCAERRPTVTARDTVSWLTIGNPYRPPLDPALPAPDPGDKGAVWTDWAASVLSAAGHSEPQAPALLQGFASGWAFHQALLIAGDLPGGLSRPNLLLAARAMHLTHPGLVDGVGYGMQGVLDGELIEGAPILRYRPGSRTWGPSDLGVIDVAGQTPACRWDRYGRACT